MEKKGELDKAYFDEIPIEVYHHPMCPGVSSSTLKNVLARKPAPKESEAFLFGNAFHCLVLEPGEFEKRYSIGLHDPNKIFVDFADYSLLLKMQDVLKSHEQAMELMAGGVSERTFFVRDQQTGVLKKCRTDRMKITDILDLKTCANAAKSEFQYSAKKYGYGFSAAYYIEIVSEVLGIWLENFTWIAVDKMEEPKVGLYRPNQDCISKCSMQVRDALEIYKLNKTLKVKPFVGASPEPEEIYV